MGSGTYVLGEAEDEAQDEQQAQDELARERLCDVEEVGGFVVHVLSGDDVIDFAYHLRVVLFRHNFCESFRQHARVKGQGQIGSGDEEHAVVGFFLQLDLFPHFVAHVGADEHIDGDIFGGHAVFFDLDEVLSNADVAEVADSVFLEGSERVGLF